jgi:hypothetical protein
MSEGHGAPQIVEPVLDLQLRLLIRVVEQSEDNRVPITLNVAGAVVHGYLASAAAWRTRWVECVGAMAGPGKENLSFFPHQVLEVVDEVESGQERVERLPRWLHLLDVRMVTGSVNTLVDLPLWRGRLADVAGWSLGVPEAGL